MDRKRPLDVIFICALHYAKMPILSRMKKAFGRRFVMHGLASWKRNLYYNATCAGAGYRRGMRDHRFRARMRQAADLIERGKASS